MVSFCKLKKMLCVGGIFALAIASYVLGYKYISKNNSKSLGSNLENKNYTVKIEHNKTDKNNTNSDNDADIRSVWVGDNEKVESATKITTISMDVENNELEKISEKAPLAYVGFTKVQLAKYYEYYIMNQPTEEMENGLVGIDIVSFSKEEVIVKKVYDKSNVTYFVTEDDGLVKVYYSDRETLYENTGISVTDLPDIEQKSIKLGMMVEDKDELIAILEGYSS